MITYYKKDQSRLRFQFNGVDTIDNNYSQAMQDIFVLSILNGKKHGTYVEIGGDHPLFINNSYLLESKFGWTGISIDINQDKVYQYNNIRKNKCICTNAVTADYESMFRENKLPSQIDYLQLDIDPPGQTLSALKKLPHHKYRFSVITYETDLYNGGTSAQIESQKLLLSLGYELLVQNVSNDGYPYEDWYVDPATVDASITKLFKQTDTATKEHDTCIFKTSSI